MPPILGLILLAQALLLLAGNLPTNQRTVLHDTVGSQAALKKLLLLPRIQRTSSRALSFCASESWPQGGVQFGCAWLVISGRQGNQVNSTNTETARASLGAALSPVEMLSCFDPAATLCTIEPPIDDFTMQSSCIGCGACKFSECESDHIGCYLACMCSCGGAESGGADTVPCYELCDGREQCTTSGLDESPEGCKAMRTLQATTPPRMSHAGRISLALPLVFGLLALAILLAIVAIVLCKRGQRADGAPAVEWRRLSTTPPEAANPDSDFEVPLHSRSPNPLSAADVAADNDDDDDVNA